MDSKVQQQFFIACSLAGSFLCQSEKEEKRRHQGLLITSCIIFHWNQQCTVSSTHRGCLCKVCTWTGHGNKLHHITVWHITKAWREKNKVGCTRVKFNCMRYCLVDNTVTVTKNWEYFVKHTESKQTTTKSTLV